LIQDWRTLERPNVGPKLYWKEIVFLTIGFFTPIIFWAIWRDPEIFGASGSITVFLSVLAEFFLLHKLNVKHINNALRVENYLKVEKKLRPLRFSLVAEVITWFALFIAAYGTIIWGFGEMIARKFQC